MAEDREIVSENIDSIELALARVGMTGRRARFYISALQLGPASVQQIAGHCGITRTTAYSLVEKLVEERVITLIHKSGRTQVVAEDPEILLRNLDDKRATLSELLPELRSIYAGSQSGPRFRLYEGGVGIQTVLNSVLMAQTDTICGMLSMRELLRFPGREELAHFVAKRVDAGKTLRVIRSATEDVDDIWGTSDEELREVRFTPTSSPLLMTTFIYDDRVSIISSQQENYGLIIESAGYANVQMTLFESLWTASK